MCICFLYTFKNVLLSLSNSIQHAVEVDTLGVGLVSLFCMELAPSLQLTIQRYVDQITTSITDSLSTDDWTSSEVKVSGKNTGRRRSR